MADEESSGPGAMEGTENGRLIDVIIVGSGPAGLSLASEISRRGRSVAVVSPDPEAVWPATYACWVDELPVRFHSAIGHRWSSVVAWGNRRHRLDRPYAVLDNAKLHQSLLEDLPPASLLRGVVSDVRLSGSVWRVTLEDGSQTSTRVVIDAAGVVGAASAPAGGAAFQTAFGVTVSRQFAPADLDDGGAVLMDWRPLSISHGRLRQRASFLYALDRGDGTCLVEETSLASAPGLGLDELRLKLVARVGARAVESGVVEEVSIRMTSPSRSGALEVCRFGAAAGFVNPTTGYSVSTSLRRAPSVAAAIDEALASGTVDLRSMKAINEAVWSRTARRTRALHDFGLRALLRLSPEECAEFFDVFFDLPTRVWSAYLSTESSARSVAAAMRKLFAACPWRLRRRLVVLGPGLLLKALTG